jgi:hypothetical protein
LFAISHQTYLYFFPNLASFAPLREVTFGSIFPPSMS